MYYHNDKNFTTTKEKNQLENLDHISKKNMEEKNHCCQNIVTYNNYNKSIEDLINVHIDKMMKKIKENKKEQELKKISNNKSLPNESLANEPFYEEI